MEQQQKFSYGIIGAGVYGLSIAYHLAKMQQTVAIFQRFTIGHHNGSSHGPQRITRSVYEHDFYRDMNTMALKKYWPQMEQTLDSKLIFPNEFICFEQRKQEYEKTVQVAQTAKTKISFMSPQQICEKFPSMPFIECSNTPVVDFEAGMIAADDYVSRLSQYLKKLPNVIIFQNTEVKNISKTPKQVSISTETEIIGVEKLVVAAGRWVLDLFPELQDILHVTKQYLAHFNLQNPELYQFGRIPSFVHFTQGLKYYTTPDRKGFGFKIGSHNMDKELRDEATACKEIRESHIRVGKKLFGNKFKGINKFDECYYTITKTEDFILDWLDPQEEKILICSCCSGHGFKFSPLIGKIISDLMESGKSLQVFEKNKYLCQIPYHRGMNLS